MCKFWRFYGFSVEKIKKNVPASCLCRKNVVILRPILTNKPCKNVIYRLLNSLI